MDLPADPRLDTLEEPKRGRAPGLRSH
jgi:hypothetical protein